MRAQSVVADCALCFLSRRVMPVRGALGLVEMLDADGLIELEASEAADQIVEMLVVGGAGDGSRDAGLSEKPRAQAPPERKRCVVLRPATSTSASTTRHSRRLLKYFQACGARGLGVLEHRDRICR